MNNVSNVVLSVPIANQTSFINLGLNLSSLSVCSSITFRHLMKSFNWATAVSTMVVIARGECKSTILFSD